MIEKEEAAVHHDGGEQREDERDDAEARASADFRAEIQPQSEQNARDNRRNQDEIIIAEMFCQQMRRPDAKRAEHHAEKQHGDEREESACSEVLSFWPHNTIYTVTSCRRLMALPLNKTPA